MRNSPYWYGRIRETDVFGVWCVEHNLRIESHEQALEHIQKYHDPTSHRGFSGSLPGQDSPSQADCLCDWDEESPCPQHHPTEYRGRHR